MKQIYKPGDLARDWDVSDRHVRRLIEEKKLEALKIGKVYRISEDEKQRFERKNRTGRD